MDKKIFTILRLKRFYFLYKTYVVGTQMNPLNSFEHPNHILKLMNKKADNIVDPAYTVCISLILVYTVLF